MIASPAIITWIGRQSTISCSRKVTEVTCPGLRVMRYAGSVPPTPGKARDNDKRDTGPMPAAWECLLDRLFQYRRPVFIAIHDELLLVAEPAIIDLLVIVQVQLALVNRPQ